MSNRALWAAFQKVKTDVDAALVETREKEEKKRIRAEKAAVKARQRARRKEEMQRALLRARFEKERKERQAKEKAAQEKAKRAKSAPAQRSRTNALRRALKTEVKSKKPQAQKPQRDRAQARAQAKVEKRILSFAERQNPIPPFTLMEGLPVSERADEVKDLIQKNQVVIVCGETGSGKTTQLPKIALMAGCGRTGRIAHTQPRRIAASSIAKRIAEELKTELGEVVGYKVRFTDQTSPGATIKLMTDGILLAETQGDPMLRAYDTIIIDEAHERSLNIDFLLGYLKRLLPKRPDLKVIVTSATIDAQRFAEHFAKNGVPAPVISISGRTYPVEIRYHELRRMDEGDDRTMLEAIDRAVSELEMAGNGDILVFMPGEREIREAQDYLRRSRVGKVEILPLFARLSAADQAKVFASGRMRRIVLATNVAETSITVPGIRYVVDTGLARVKRYSYRSKVEQLQIEPISQAAANQRSGRCGRVANGICIRLYGEKDFAARKPFTDPEILRTNLAGVILRAKSLKLGDIRSFPFIEMPPPRAIADGLGILQELGAITEDGALTKVGRELARLPVDPKLGRMLYEASLRDSLEEVLIITSALSIQDPRERPLEQQEAADTAHKIWADERSDFLSFVNLWRWYHKANERKESNRKLEALLHRQFLSVRRLREWKDVYRQLVRLVSELGWRRNTADATYEQVHRALLSGLLGNIGQKAVESDFRAPPYLGARGIKFFLWPGSVRAKKGGRWLMAADIVDTTRLYARTLAEVEPEWIERAAGDLVRRHATEPRWEKRRGEVVGSERGTLYGLTLYAARTVLFEKYDPKVARRIFIRQALLEGELEPRPAFLKHNMRLVQQISELEHKTRRPDVLVDDEQIVAFYDEKLPEVMSRATDFRAWRKEAEKANPKLLYLEKEDLMRHGADRVTQDYFPKTLTMAGVRMNVTYHFEPGSPRDGVTLQVPVFALNQLDATQCEWLVPGMVKEKAQIFLKNLPQKIRRHCIPLPEYADGFVRRVSETPIKDRGPFASALARDIRQEVGVRCHSSDFKTENCPAHLFMNFRVIDEHGRTLELGRNLAELRQKLGGVAQSAFQRMAQADERLAKDLGDNIQDWTFGTLPEIMEIRRKGEVLIGHPALVDKGSSCSIEVFDDPFEAQREHKKGLRRLFRLVLRRQVKFVERTLKDLGRIQMQAAVVPGLQRLFESQETLARNVIDAVLQDTALAQPWPQNAERFHARKDDVRSRMTLVAGEVARLLTRIVRRAVSIPMKLRRFQDAPNLVRAIEEQLESLFTPNFMYEVPLGQLKHYPRYLKAIHMRLDRYRDDVARDEERRRSLQALRTPYLRARVARKGVEDPQLRDFRWLLEELRVSLFAQQLRTPMPVSVKRLERIWGTMQSNL